MGVNVRIVLPPNVRLRDVGAVLGVAAGLPPLMVRDASSSAMWVVVGGVTVSSVSGEVEVATIRLNGKLVDGIGTHTVTYHFEGPGGTRLLCPSSTPFWIACGLRLVEFFGGSVTFQDTYDTPDRSFPWKPDALNCPEDGEEWESLQARIAAVRPVTADELEECAGFAAHK